MQPATLVSWRLDLITGSPEEANAIVGEPTLIARCRSASSCCKASAAECRAAAQFSFCYRDTQRAPAGSRCVPSRRGFVLLRRADYCARFFAVRRAAALRRAIL